MGAALAALAAGTILVVPFTPGGQAPGGAGIAVAEVILDAAIQENQHNFIALEQLATVLRRRDLRLDDPALSLLALQLGRSLGATDVVSGEAVLESGRWRIVARRTKVSGGEGAEVVEEGPRSALPALAHAAASKLLAVRAPNGPPTRSAAALELAGACEAHLARQPLGRHARASLGAAELEAAAEACGAALRADPKLGLARAGMAVTLAVQGRYADARGQARRAQAGRFVPLAVLAEAFAAKRMRNWPEWRRILERAVIERRGFLHALGSLAEDRMEQGDDEAALAILDRYLQLSPRHPWAMSQKARQLARTGRIDAAVELSEQALALDPGDPELLNETAARYIDAGRDGRARTLLEQALRALPPSPLAALRLAGIHLRANDPGMARAALERCLQLARREDESLTRGIAHAQLARVHARQDRYLETIEELHKARGEGNDSLPCAEPELARWKDREELRQVCVQAEAGLADLDVDDAVPVEF